MFHVTFLTMKGKKTKRFAEEGSLRRWLEHHGECFQILEVTRDGVEIPKYKNFRYEELA